MAEKWAKVLTHRAIRFQSLPKQTMTFGMKSMSAPKLNVKAILINGIPARCLGTKIPSELRGRCPTKLVKWFVNGLFHLLIYGIYLGYNPLIRTFDPSHQSMAVRGSFSGGSVW